MCWLTEFAEKLGLGSSARPTGFRFRDLERLRCQAGLAGGSDNSGIGSERAKADQEMARTIALTILKAARASLQERTRISTPGNPDSGTETPLV